MGLPGKKSPVVGDDGEQRSGFDGLEGAKDCLEKKPIPAGGHEDKGRRVKHPGQRQYS
jgi:hypothetical protein